MDAHLLAGVTVPLVTVLDADGRPDAAGAQPLLRAVADAAVDALLLLGSNGEGALLPAELTSRYLVEVAAYWRAVRPGGRVLINLSAAGTLELLRRAELALAAAPDALVATPPGYFRHGTAEVVHHLRSLERFAHPWAIYNSPKYACPLTVEALEAVLDAPHLIGMKDSSADLATLTGFIQTATARPDFAVSQGDERALLAGLLAGAVGIVPGVANIAPSLATALLASYRTGDIDSAQRAQDEMTDIVGMHAIRPGVPTVKAVLHDRGLLANPLCAPPLLGIGPDDLHAVNTLLFPHERWLIGRSAPSLRG